MEKVLLILGLVTYWGIGFFWAWCNSLLDEYEDFKGFVVSFWFLSVFYFIFQICLIVNGQQNLQQFIEDRNVYLFAYVINLALSRKLIVMYYPVIKNNLIKLAQLIGRYA
jgi:hypothetical protein